MSAKKKEEKVEQPVIEVVEELVEEPVSEQVEESPEHAQVTQQVRKNYVAPKPYNELDLNFMLTDPAWGKDCPEELYQKVSKIVGEAYKDKDGNLVIDSEPMWGLLAYYTRDLRLGNLSSIAGEIKYCQYWLDFAGDLLRENYIKSFLSAIARVITLLELSQSKNGFLRRRQGTITSERISKDNDEPGKKNWMGGKRPSR